MPKLRIGEKIVAGHSKEAKREFTDGHKCFTTAEASIQTETNVRERKTADAFLANKTSLIKARNPLIGEETPRTKVNAKGEVIGKTGVPLFPVASTPRSLQTETARTTMQFDEYGSPKENNPLKRADKNDEVIGSLQNLQDNITGELEYLKLKLRDKQQKLLDMKGGGYL